MNKSFAAGIDVGGTFIKCALANRWGDLLHTASFAVPTKAGKDDIIRLIKQAVGECADEAGKKGGRLCGLGVGFPGVVSKGIVHGGADNLSGFTHYPLQQTLIELTGLDPVIVDNDANMMGWGETIYGSAEDLENVIFLTIGTGVGGSMIINGELYGGHNNKGAEIGHIIIQKDGLECTCGARGCLEAYASVDALVNRYAGLKKIGKCTVNGKGIVKNYLAGEVEAVEALHWHLDHLSVGIAGLVNVFSPQKIIIGGGIAGSGSFYIDALKIRVKRMAMKETSENTEIMAATLGNWAGCLGATGRVFAVQKH